MTKNGFLAENSESPELCCVFTFWPEDIQQNADRIHYFNAEMGKNTKNRVIESETGSGKCAVIRSTRNDRSDYSGTTELYRTASLTVPNSTAIFCYFLNNFLQNEKKIRVGTKIVGRVGLPEPNNFFVLALSIFQRVPRKLKTR